MAPTQAVSQLLKRNNLALQDFDFYEIHEAFAGQVLCTLKAWESDLYCKKELGLNKALGSVDRNKNECKRRKPCIGASPSAPRVPGFTGTMAKLLEIKGSGRGLISVCTGGGNGSCRHRKPFKNNSIGNQDIKI